MKKTFKLLSLSLFIVLGFSILFTSCGKFTPESIEEIIENTEEISEVIEEEVSPKGETSLPEKHLILNADGSYGGTLNNTKYGAGAPLNGELDSEKEDYYKVNDYYNATSTNSRLMITNFMPYQRTTAKSGGLCCALMAMYHFGFNDTRIYSEERLLTRYEQLNNTSIKSNGTTPEGLKKLFNSYGLVAKTTSFSGKSRNGATFVSWVKDCMKNNYIVMVPSYTDGGYEWHLIVGIDECNSGVTNDDVAILANPFDAYDHYQDGYSTMPISLIVSYWLNVERDVVIKSGASKESYSFPCENVIVQAPEGFNLNLEKGPETLKPNESVPELHLLPEADGTYGGKMWNEDFTKQPWGGSENWATPADNSVVNLNSVYYKFNDYYNYDDAGSRVCLNHYRTKRQTTASTCGICSTLSALVYYGYQYDESNRNLNDKIVMSEYKIMKWMEAECDITVYNRGCANYEISDLVKNVLGLSVVHSAGYNMTNYLKGTASKVYSTYSKFTSTLKTDLNANHPFLIGWRVGGGHWEVVFCYDDMGTSSPYDDVCLLADSSDSADHYMDGYNTYSAMWVYNHWWNGSFHWNQQGIVFKR